MKKLFFILISLIGCAVSAMAQCPPPATSSSNVVLTQRTAKVGMLSGEFSIGGGKKVSFSKGNLQYQASTDTWRFAENQWDYIGNALGNTNANSTTIYWIDIFGWGTSGYNNKYPWMNSTNNSDYPSAIAGTNYDWGIYNSGQLGSGWRTLTKDELSYIVNSRPGSRWAKAIVHGNQGLILLPDGWTQAKSAMAATLLNINTPGSTFASNTISNDNWAALEKEGAVFLPVTGRRAGGWTVSNTSEGYYWTSTAYGSSSVNYLWFSNAGFDVTGDYRSRILAVRLVHEL